jgi:hypothetical protein
MFMSSPTPVLEQVATATATSRHPHVTLFKPFADQISKLAALELLTAFSNINDEHLLTGEYLWTICFFSDPIRPQPRPTMMLPHWALMSPPTGKETIDYNAFQSYRSWRSEPRKLVTEMVSLVGGWKGGSSEVSEAELDADDFGAGSFFLVFFSFPGLFPPS